MDDSAIDSLPVTAVKQEEMGNSALKAASEPAVGEIFQKIEKDDVSQPGAGNIGVSIAPGSDSNEVARKKPRTSRKRRCCMDGMEDEKEDIEMGAREAKSEAIELERSTSLSETSAEVTPPDAEQKEPSKLASAQTAAMSQANPVSFLMLAFHLYSASVNAVIMPWVAIFVI